MSDEVQFQCYRVNGGKTLYDTLERAKEAAYRFLPSVVAIEEFMFISKVPNLDAMSVEELQQFYLRHQCGRWYDELFPVSRPGVKVCTSDLANYAANKLTAMGLRAQGRIGEAQRYETICDRIYNGLPDWSRW